MELLEESEIESANFGIEEIGEDLPETLRDRGGIPQEQTGKSVPPPRLDAHNALTPDVYQIACTHQFHGLKSNNGLLENHGQSQPEATACTRQPRQIPNVVKRAARRPRDKAFFVTRAVSAPGVSVEDWPPGRRTSESESPFVQDRTGATAGPTKNQ